MSIGTLRYGSSASSAGSRCTCITGRGDSDIMMKGELVLGDLACSPLCGISGACCCYAAAAWQQSILLEQSWQLFA
jgi:hypothetical protein